MHAPTRMSPLTAFFLGLFGVGAIGVASGAVIFLYGLRMVDRHFGSAVQIVENVAANLPDFIEGLPPAIKDALHDRRAPEYAANIETDVELVKSKDGESSFPTLTIKNKGNELVSLLTVRVAALDAQGRAIREWTTAAATPIGIEREWRGPLMPGSTRHVVLDHGCFFEDDLHGAESLVVEIADIRVWTSPTAEMQASAMNP